MNLDEALDILRGRVPEQDPDRVTEAEQTLLPIVEAALTLVASPESVEAFEGLRDAVYDARPLP